MLRWAFWALLLANLVYFAGTQGHLGALGWTPADPREPQRLTQQIEPERLRLLNGPRGSEPPAPLRAPTTAAAPVTAPEPTAVAEAPSAAAASTTAPAATDAVQTSALSGSPTDGPFYALKAA